MRASSCAGSSTGCAFAVARVLRAVHGVCGPSAVASRPEVVGCSRRRRRGLQLAAVSNWDSRLPGVLNGLRLDRHFEVVLVSALRALRNRRP